MNFLVFCWQIQRRGCVLCEYVTLQFFPLNLDIFSFRILKMATIVRAQCKECLKENGDLFCFECEYILCSNCKPVHLKRKGSKKHHIEKAYSNLLSRRPICPRHGKEVIFYCDSCCLLICPTCMLEKHKDHDVQDIDDAVVRKTVEIKEKIAAFESKTSRMKQVIDDLQSAIDSYKVDNSILATRVKARVETLNSAISNQASAILQEISDEESAEIKLKTDYIEKLKDKISICESQKSRLENNLNLTSNIDLLMTYTDENTDLCDMGNTETNMQPILQIKFVEPSNDNEEIPGMFGKLEKGCMYVIYYFH